METKIPARGKALMATDLSISIPKVTYAHITPRSSFALKHSIDVDAGVIDTDYRRQVWMILFNQSTITDLRSTFLAFAVDTACKAGKVIFVTLPPPPSLSLSDLRSSANVFSSFCSM
ncbi:deoxyuridine 5'-triphosphate nucleotidohydrolase-like [Arachis stenosperma]|uniref:deoxyuridine 5'-triphosphate nucleotidohydrolase-like n=1 Tax=Arachis stenosperma TaxID=217475 RepID=UPI0025AB9550|nr:deoxyuridine 5'-triphosphate nucleotidohydrolase-like [Arachis stenosperma]